MIILGKTHNPDKSKRFKLKNFLIGEEFVYFIFVRVKLKGTDLKIKTHC